MTAGLDLKGFAAQEEKVLASKSALLTISEAAASLGTWLSIFAGYSLEGSPRSWEFGCRTITRALDLGRIWPPIDGFTAPKTAC